MERARRFKRRLRKMRSAKRRESSGRLTRDGRGTLCRVKRNRERRCWRVAVHRYNPKQGTCMLKLSEDEARGLDAIYKGAAVAALILGGLWTLAQYLLHRAEERETAAIEARKPFLEKRFQVYNEIVLAAATVVTSA